MSRPAATCCGGGPGWDAPRRSGISICSPSPSKPRATGSSSFYQADEFPSRPPVLWVFAFGPDDHVRVAVTVHATPGRGWGYCEAGRARHGYLSHCGDTKHAAEQVDALLKHRMFPATW